MENFLNAQFTLPSACDTVHIVYSMHTLLTIPVHVCLNRQNDPCTIKISIKPLCFCALLTLHKRTRRNRCKRWVGLINLLTRLSDRHTPNKVISAMCRSVLHHLTIRDLLSFSDGLCVPRDEKHAVDQSISW